MSVITLAILGAAVAIITALLLARPVKADNTDALPRNRGGSHHRRRRLQKPPAQRAPHHSPF
ncbi:hypothetical protein [Streptomyces corynorhini]|uniref:Uncharacterized protein n=1 Tax=Streptomyces corynorhini TaxID=2282652 RepID=A0A370BAF1_9ACTN|nr:hypothetical protein [Streptomyces corynorhini]RDG37622.1 hypothetical protein DVH02_13530 [Streptomyces corynorhini]